MSGSKAEDNRRYATPDDVLDKVSADHDDAATEIARRFIEGDIAKRNNHTHHFKAGWSTMTYREARKTKAGGSGLKRRGRGNSLPHARARRGHKYR